MGYVLSVASTDTCSIPQHAKIVTNVCSTSSKVDGDVPVVRVRRGDEGGKAFKVTAVILKPPAPPVIGKIRIGREHKVALGVTIQANPVSSVKVLSRMNEAHDLPSRLYFTPRPPAATESVPVPVRAGDDFGVAVDEDARR